MDSRPDWLLCRKTRCEAFAAQPLRDGWEGIWDFLEK